MPVGDFGRGAFPTRPRLQESSLFHPRNRSVPEKRPYRGQGLGLTGPKRSKLGRAFLDGFGQARVNERDLAQFFDRQSGLDRHSCRIDQLGCVGPDRV